MTYIAHHQTTLGPITLASNGQRLTGLWFDGQKYFGATIGPLVEEKVLPIFDQTRQWLDQYFAGQRPLYCPPLLVEGSAFFTQVSRLMQEIPYGSTVTYGQLSEKVAKLAGKKTYSAQAVGGAVGHNPISIIIPCHRVLGSKGQLTGYAGGIDKKIALLRLEGIEI